MKDTVVVWELVWYLAAGTGVLPPIVWTGKEVCHLCFGGVKGPLRFPVVAPSSSFTPDSCLSRVNQHRCEYPMERGLVKLGSGKGERWGKVYFGFCCSLSLSYPGLTGDLFVVLN